ncbi:hypothetical protein Ocin01_10507 [Orchesella cincta]|uniref:Uncharacterized protein n=1 Tax=Orchesella cincta TaxID=48709 RepID=A0A1D2MT38_ORCCI|nr:hypothetical protein Ocin01_10507 [Orchesella cincta]
MSIKSVKGLRLYYPTDKGPIDTYQLGHDGRVEYLAAEIGVDHLDKGNDTNDEWVKWAKTRGTSTDEPGLILSSRLGGSGTDKTNLFPKSPLLDKTLWKEHEQAAVEEASDMRKWKKIKFAIKLEYPSDDSTRPSALEYQYDLPSGTVLYGKVKNEAAAGEVEPEEEEYEEEEEEEYEEEEIEEEEPAPAEEAPKVEAVTPTPVQAEVSKVEPPPLTVEPASPSPPPEPVIVEKPKPTPTEPTYQYRSPIHEPPKAASPARDEHPRNEPSPKKAKPSKEKIDVQERSIITKSDLIELIPVIGSCKLALETAQAAYNGDGKLALRKAVQCSISLVADFYFGRAIARHGQILAKQVTEQTIVRFVSKAENQIIIVSTFKAGNQLLNTLSRMLS